MNYAVAILGVLLALSVAGNAYLYHEHDKLTSIASATGQLATDTRTQAQACSDSVDELAKDGRRRHAEILANLAANSGVVQALQKSSMGALSSRPDDPADLCGSLLRFYKAQLQAERAP